jgi:hypothetical protein
MQLHNERQVILRTGGKRAVRCQNARHVYFHGITAVSEVNTTIKMPNGLFFNEGGRHIRYYRCLGSGSNIGDTHEQHVFHNQSSYFSYYEECEALDFDRHGFSLYRSLYATARRCYANSRKESSGITAYRSNHAVIEDCICEGRAKFPNQSDDRSEGNIFGNGTYFPYETSHHNLWNQIVLLGGEFINPNFRFTKGGTNEGSEWHHVLIVNSYRSMLSESDNGDYSNLTVYAAGSGANHPGLMLDRNRAWDSINKQAPNVLRVKNTVVWKCARGAYQEQETLSATRDLSHCILWENGGSGTWDSNKSINANTLYSVTPVAQASLIGTNRVFQNSKVANPAGTSDLYGWGTGKTLVWVPEGAEGYNAGTSEYLQYAADKHIGATILWRSETERNADGTLKYDANGRIIRNVTNKPLWRPSDGKFPCGAKVKGINDFDGTGAWNINKNVYNVHERLYLHTVTLPYGGGPTSTTPPPADTLTSGTYDARISRGDDDSYRSNTNVQSDHTYFGGGNNAGSIRSGVGLWRNVNIPQGATIESAYIELTARTNRFADTVNLKITGAAADVPEPILTNSAWNAVARTTAEVLWSAVPDFTQDAVYQTPELKTIIQEIVNRTGWASGNPLQLFIEDNGSTEASNTDRFGWSFDGDSAKAPRLVIKWTSETATIVTGTYTGRTAASADDAYRSGSTVSATNTWFGAGKNTNTIRRGVGIWRSVTVPKGATIKAAYLQLTASVDRSNQTVNLRFTGQADDNPTALPTGSTSWDSTPRTTALADWNNVPTFLLDTVYTTPSLVEIIQEIVNRPGWASGNNLVLFMEDNGSTADLGNVDRYGWSYDGDPLKAPRLVIDYEYQS